MTGRLPLACALGTFTSASPSNTTSPSTSQRHDSRARDFSGISSATVTMTDHRIADLYRGAEIQRLRDIDGARARQARAEHRRDQARGVKPMRDARAERGLGGEMLRQMDGIAVAGQLREADHVGRRHGLLSRSVMPTERSSKNNVRSGGRPWVLRARRTAVRKLDIGDSIGQST